VLTGDVSITVEETEPLVLSEESLKITLDEENNTDMEVMTYDVQKPGIYRLTVTSFLQEGDQFGNRFEVKILQDESYIASISVTGVKGILEFEVSTAGKLNIILDSYIYQPKDYEVTLAPAE
jgi:hypothetical protein